MKYLCVYDDEFGIGSTLENAFNNMKDRFDEGREAEDCEFYELGNQIKVEVKLVPVVQTQISAKLPK